MRVIRQFGAVVLLLALWLAPAMACITPDAQLSPQERACCRMMKYHCGQLEMPASHGCCHKDVQSNQHNALQTKSVALHPEIAILADLFIAGLWNQKPTSARWIEHPELSPPQSPPSSVSVLRI
jgi:hypothetical protein